MHEKCALCRRGMQPDPRRPGKHIDPETGILPIAEWGAACGRGFVHEPQPVIEPAPVREAPAKRPPPAAQQLELFQ